MTTDPTRTRRGLLKTGAAVAGGLLAGCTGTNDAGPTTGDGDADEGTTPAGGTGNADGTGTSGGAAGSYSVSMVPVGTVAFDGVPETWAANNGSWADMGIALGLEPPKGVYLTGRYHTQYYDGIGDVSVEKGGIRELWGEGGVGKEQFYAMDADVHVMDPNFLRNRGNWSQADVEEIGTNVGPFFGNSIFSRTYPWHSEYRYYTLYEAFGKLAEVFQRTDRYEAFASLHERFQSSLADVVPPEGERPAAAVVWGSGDQPEQFYPYVQRAGTSFKHLDDLGVGDALANTDVKDFHANRGAIDYETLLEVDPPVLLVRGQEAKTAEAFQRTVVSFMEGHDVASRLTAVENGDVYRAGPLYQGPISNLVVTERLARSLYGTDGELFDRKRVAAIVSGDA